MSIARALRFLARYMREPLYVCMYLLTFWRKGFTLNVAMYSEEEVAAAVRTGKSIIRFGDGEVNLLLRLRNHYHAYSPRLRQMLKDIICSYSDKSPFILAIPKFVNDTNADLERTGKRNVWMPLKVVFLLSFPKRARYMDAHSFYYDGYFERVIVPAIGGKRIVLVTNAATIAKQRENPVFPWKDFVSVATPEEEALASYGRVRDEVCETLRSLGPSVTLVSMGPAGKYLVKELAESGYQAIDIGKVAEVMFTGESIAWMI